jgi:nitroreductase
LDAIGCIKARRSVRNYENRPIAKDIIEDIIDCARLAPTAVNMQPWEFVVVTNSETKAKIAQAATYGKFIADSGACIVVCVERSSKFPLEDCCAAVENILISAKAHSLGSCWVAGWKRPYSGEISSLIGLPENIEIVALIAVGYPKSEPKSPPKRKLSEVLHWEKF